MKITYRDIQNMVIDSMKNHNCSTMHGFLEMCEDSWVRIKDMLASVSGEDLWRFEQAVDHTYFFRRGLCDFLTYVRYHSEEANYYQCSKFNWIIIEEVPRYINRFCTGVFHDGNYGIAECYGIREKMNESIDIRLDLIEKIKKAYEKDCYNFQACSHKQD